MLPEVHEDEHLLLPSDSPPERPRQRGIFQRLAIGHWHAHPFWLIPVVLVMSISRGITMAPRIKVYTDIACRVLSEAESQGHFVEYDCSNSAVQGRAAKLQASIVTIMSVLSALVTGPWSRLGDAQGRKIILCLSMFGALSMDFAFILVSHPKTVFGRHAEQLILLGPILDGCVGGLSTFNGVVHAYISDCTRHGSRSKIFSTIQGIVFVGLAIGPWVGGVVMPAEHENISFFYLSASLLVLLSLYIILLCPESIEPSQSNRSETPSHLREFTPAYVRHHLRKLVAALISPIAMFAPRPHRVIPGKKDYNLMFLGLALFLYLLSIGIYSNKYLYAQHIYDWTTAQLGHYMSLLWVTRAFNLLVFLPIVISYLKPKVTISSGTTPPPEVIAAELRFDKLLAGYSLAVDGFANFMVAITPTSSEVSYIAFSCLSSFTSGGNPSLHSLGAVCLHACGFSSEVGALFGAMAVLSAIAHAISPTMYAHLYSATVGTYPQTIFFLAAGLLSTAVLLLSRIKASLKHYEVSLTASEEQGLLAPEVATPPRSD